MDRQSSPAAVGLLLSGGLDSCILLGELLRQGHRVQPFYVQSQLVWQREELLALESFIWAVASPQLLELVVLEMPLGDVYGDHWSVTGHEVPDAATADDAVYLPGRNALLVIKAALWCHLHGIDRLALAVLGGNPFADAGDDFFDRFESSLNRATGGRLRITRPFGRLAKREVMQLGLELPLELTFSCIAPAGGLHCGRCNKCAERKAAFRLVGAEDLTSYATTASHSPARGGGPKLEMN